MLVTSVTYFMLILMHWPHFLIAHCRLLPRYASALTLTIVHACFSFHCVIILVPIRFPYQLPWLLYFIGRDPLFRDLEGCYGLYRTFLISNLTSEPDLVFHWPPFPNNESHLGFSFLFCLPFKNKTKISGDSKSFFFNNKSFFK